MIIFQLFQQTLNVLISRDFFLPADCFFVCLVIIALLFRLEFHSSPFHILENSFYNKYFKYIQIFRPDVDPSIAPEAVEVFVIA